jgi:hypothetical protein
MIINYKNEIRLKKYFILPPPAPPQRGGHLANMLEVKLLYEILF